MSWFFGLLICFGRRDTSLGWLTVLAFEGFIESFIDLRQHCVFFFQIRVSVAGKAWNGGMLLLWWWWWMGSMGWWRGAVQTGSPASVSPGRQGAVDRSQGRRDHLPGRRTYPLIHATTTLVSFFCCFVEEGAFLVGAFQTLEGRTTEGLARSKPWSSRVRQFNYCVLDFEIT